MQITAARDTRQVQAAGRSNGIIKRNLYVRIKMLSATQWRRIPLSAILGVNSIANKEL